MTVRKRFLSEGWYPADSSGAARDLDSCVGASVPPGEAIVPDAAAAVAPHASWFYSGALAAAAVASLRRGADTVVVFGGHLSERADPAMAEEDAFSTPFGPIAADAELRAAVGGLCRFVPDRGGDNTVEIQLPLVRRFFPSAKVLWLRMPASMASFELGMGIARIVRASGKSVVALGSTDLTHYGPNYGFSPMGTGAEALRWVRGANDKRFLDALLAGNAAEALRRALDEGSACSPGAAVAAMGFALEMGCARSRLLRYATSADVSPASSFVGYAALSWSAG